jgi:hypothetical protein
MQMADKTSSQSQHGASQSHNGAPAADARPAGAPTAGFPFAFPQIPLAGWQAGPDAMRSFQEEWAKLEAQGLERARQAIEELARLGQASLAYAAQLSSETRRLGAEATQRTLDLMGTRG